MVTAGRLSGKRRLDPRRAEVARGPDDTARDDLLDVLDDRYGRRGTLLTSQVPIDHWHDIVGDPPFGDAILDRLLHNAHRVVLKGGSMRRLYDSTKGETTTDDEPE